LNLASLALNSLSAEVLSKGVDMDLSTEFIATFMVFRVAERDSREGPRLAETGCSDKSRILQI
jgi:hypothetical protein